MATLLEELNREEFSFAQELMGIFERRSDDGQYHFSDVEVHHFLPLVFLTITPADSMPEVATIVVGEASALAGLRPGVSAEEVRDLLVQHYTEHPVNPELLEAFNSFVREKLRVGADNSRKGAASAAFLGEIIDRLPVAERARGARGGHSPFALRSQELSGRSPSRKPATKKPATKKPATKKPATKKSATKKSATKVSSPKKAAKKPTTKKVAKSSRKRVKASSAKQGSRARR